VWAKFHGKQVPTGYRDQHVTEEEPLQYIDTGIPCYSSMVQHKAQLIKHFRSEGRLFQNEYTVSSELDFVQ